MLYYAIQALADCFLLLLLDDGKRGLSFFMPFFKARQVRAGAAYVLTLDMQCSTTAKALPFLLWVNIP